MGDLRELREDIIQLNYSKLSFTRFPETHTGHSKQHVKFVHQSMSEVCLASLIDALRDLGEADVPPHPIYRSQPFQQYNLLRVLSYFLTNTAAIRYALTRREEFLPNLLGLMEGTSQVHVPMSVFGALSLCLVADDSVNLADELINKYNLLDHSMKVLPCLEVYLRYAAFETFSGLCNLLVVFGGSSTLQAIQNHAVYGFLKEQIVMGLIPRFRVDAPPEFEFLYKKFVESFKGFSTRNGKFEHFKTLAPYTRIAIFHQIPNYMVFCSSPSCRKEVNADGILQHCGLCRLARYCNKSCQSQHWKTEGHKQDCIGKN